MFTVRQILKCLVIVSFVLIHASFGYANSPAPRFKHVVYLVLENEDYPDIIKNELFKKWAAQGANFTNFMAETHPSQPNYIAMISGDTLGVKDDGLVDINGRHLGDLLEEKGLDWRVYAEDFPGNCFLGKISGEYARRHVPFLSFKNVQLDSKRCSKIGDYKNLLSDWHSNKLPAFSMIIPNNRNNGHDTKIDFTANWLKQNFDAVFSNPQMMADTLVIITFDEGNRSPKNQIYTVLIGPSVIAGSQQGDKHSHYSLLRLIEDEFGLGSLGKGDFNSPVITQIWK